MIRRNRGEAGQGIVMVTLALFAMVGMMGLAVDLGWSYSTMAAAPRVLQNRQHGPSGFRTGNNAAIEVNLHGLNRNHGSLPEELRTFSPVVLWQDQRNSVVKYTETGHIDTSVGYDAPLQLIAGSLMVHANPNVRLQQLDVPVYVRKVALVE